MNFANSHNLIRCGCCDAIYDKTVKWIRGYYQGTSYDFTPAVLVRENSCPVCGNERGKP